MIHSVHRNAAPERKIQPCPLPQQVISLLLQREKVQARPPAPPRLLDVANDQLVRPEHVRRVA